MTIYTVEITTIEEVEVEADDPQEAEQEALDLRTERHQVYRDAVAYTKL